MFKKFGSLNKNVFVKQKLHYYEILAFNSNQCKVNIIFGTFDSDIRQNR